MGLISALYYAIFSCSFVLLEFGKSRSVVFELSNYKLDVGRSMASNS